MPPELLKLFFDMRQACRLIQDFARGKTLEDYNQDALLRSAIERQFIILGEALSQAIRVDPAIEAKIPDARKIVNFRNVIVHGYAKVEVVTVWGIVERFLPPLFARVEELLSGEHES
jgi:uncharacterized protein with HEPN domain